MAARSSLARAMWRVICSEMQTSPRGHPIPPFFPPLTYPADCTRPDAFTASHPEFHLLPRAVVHDPAHFEHPPPQGVPVLHYTSYAAFWGALRRNPAFGELHRCCFGHKATWPVSKAQRLAGGWSDEVRGETEAQTGHQYRGLVGEEEFRLLGCVLGAFFSPSGAVRRIMREKWGSLSEAGRSSSSSSPSSSSTSADEAGPDSVELVSAHIRLGPKHTTNYVVLPKGWCVSRTEAVECWSCLASPHELSGPPRCPSAHVMRVPGTSVSRARWLFRARRTQTRARAHTYTRSHAGALAAAFHCLDKEMQAPSRVLFLATDTPVSLHALSSRPRVLALSADAHSQIHTRARDFVRGATDALTTASSILPCVCRGRPPFSILFSSFSHIRGR